MTGDMKSHNTTMFVYEVLLNYVYDINQFKN